MPTRIRASWPALLIGALLCVTVVWLSPRAYVAQRDWRLADAASTTHVASDAEQVEILRALLDPAAVPIGDPLDLSPGARWVLVDESVVLVECAGKDSSLSCIDLDAEGQLETLPRAMRWALLQANRSASRIPDPRLARIVLKSRAESTAPFERHELMIDRWRAFRAENSQAFGKVQISRAVLDDVGGQALVYVEFKCGGECGSGYVALFARVDGAWTLREGVMLWIS